MSDFEYEGMRYLICNKVVIITNIEGNPFHYESHKLH